jgi:hypothetical protein
MFGKCNNGSQIETVQSPAVTGVLAMAWYYWLLIYWFVCVAIVFARGLVTGEDRAMYPNGRWKYYANGLWSAPIAVLILVLVLILLIPVYFLPGGRRADKKALRPPE